MFYEQVNGGIISVWCINSFLIIVEGTTAEEQSGQGNAGGWKQ